MSIAEQISKAPESQAPDVFRWEKAQGDELQGLFQDAASILETPEITKGTFDHFVMKMMLIAGGEAVLSKRWQGVTVERSKPVVGNGRVFVFERTVGTGDVSSKVIAHWPVLVDIPTVENGNFSYHRRNEFRFPLSARRPYLDRTHIHRHSADKYSLSNYRFKDELYCTRGYLRDVCLGALVVAKASLQ